MTREIRQPEVNVCTAAHQFEFVMSKVDLYRAHHAQRQTSTGTGLGRETPAAAAIEMSSKIDG